MSSPKAPCLGELLGHDFPYAGARCLHCGIDQYTLSTGSPRKTKGLSNAFDKYRPPENVPKARKVNEMQALVHEVRTQFGETAKHGIGSFGYYMRFFKRVGLDRVRIFLSETKGKDTPKKLFWWLIGDYLKNKSK